MLSLIITDSTVTELQGPITTVTRKKQVVGVRAIEGEAMQLLYADFIAFFDCLKLAEAPSGALITVTHNQHRIAAEWTVSHGSVAPGVG